MKPGGLDGMFYDRQGKPLSFAEYCELLKQIRSDSSDGIAYKRVAETTIGRLWISTVWLGMDHNFGRWLLDQEGPPLIFETMVFDTGAAEPMTGEAGPGLHPELAQYVDLVARYPSEALAQAGHDHLCVDLRVLLANIEAAEQITNDAIDNWKANK